MLEMGLQRWFATTRGHRRRFEKSDVAGGIETKERLPEGGDAVCMEEGREGPGKDST